MTDTDQPLDLDQIETRAQAATSGEWTAVELPADEDHKHPAHWVNTEYTDELGCTTYETVADCPWRQADAEYIAAVRPEVGKAMAAEIRRLRARVAELEGPAVEARAALAALCYDLEDPGTAALGALYLISQATTGVDAPRDDAAQALAKHDAQVMRRCAEFVRDTYGGEWADDAAATLERDADITERGCPGYEKEYQGVSDAKRRLANCNHCGKPRTAHAAQPAAARQ